MPEPKKHESNRDRQKAFRDRQREATAAALVAGAPKAPAVPTIPGTARWKKMHEQATAAIRTMYDEMAAYYDDRSERWQESDKGDEFKGTMEAAETLLLDMESYEFGT